MNVKTILPSRRCSIYSTKTFEGIWQAMEMTDEICRDWKLSENEISKLKLVTEEVCTNAYEYCHRKSHDHFFVSWKIKEGCLSITVSHQGELFSIPSSSYLPKLEQRGRGLLLIHSLVDHIQIEKQGNFIFFTLQKTIDSSLKGELGVS